jgi:hypothetical protein
MSAADTFLGRPMPLSLRGPARGIFWQHSLAQLTLFGSSLAIISLKNVLNICSMAQDLGKKTRMSMDCDAESKSTWILTFGVVYMIDSIASIPF